MLNILNFARKYADEIGGQFTDYDHTKAVLVVPLDEGRFQTVVLVTRKSPRSGMEQAIFTSKICDYNEFVDLKELLEESANFDYCRFIIEDGYLKVESSCILATANEQMAKDTIQEIAKLADRFELKYTGEDVH